MKKFLTSFFILIIFISNLIAKESLILESRDTALFSVFIDVTSALNCYEQGYLKGLHINFGKKGLYYDSQHGDNWWEYYFQPICLGDISEPIRFTNFGNEYGLEISDKFFHHWVIRNHIHIKPHIREKIDNFISLVFGNYYVIGVHYSGIDMAEKHEIVSYEKMFKAINQAIFNARIKKKKWIVFVATDEKEFLDQMQGRYSYKLKYLDIKRYYNDRDPVYFDLNKNPYQSGEEAIMDCLVLSKCNYMIRTNSNLSLCSIYFNPTLENECVSP